MDIQVHGYTVSDKCYVRSMCACVCMCVPELFGSACERWLSPHCCLNFMARLVTISVSRLLHSMLKLPMTQVITNANTCKKTGQLFSMCRHIGYTLPESHRRSILSFSSSKCFIAKTQLCRKEFKVCGNHFHITPLIFKRWALWTRQNLLGIIL